MQSSGLLSLPCSMPATSDLTEADKQSLSRLPGAQVISAGVQEGDLGHAVAQLHQAAAVAARYSLSTWGLSMHFVEALLTMPVSLEGTDEALKVCTGLFARTPASLTVTCTCQMEDAVHGALRNSSHACIGGQSGDKC